MSIDPLKLLHALEKQVESTGVKDKGAAPFGAYLDQATQVYNKTQVDTKGQDSLLAQVLPEERVEDMNIFDRQRVAREKANASEEVKGPIKMEVTPFQVFIDRAVSGLESISELEFQVNDLIERYTQGKASIDEVTIETSKLNIAISFASSVLTSATQTLKEITGMQI